MSIPLVERTCLAYVEPLAQVGRLEQITIAYEDLAKAKCTEWSKGTKEKSSGVNILSHAFRLIKKAEAAASIPSKAVECQLIDKIAKYAQALQHHSDAPCHPIFKFSGRISKSALETEPSCDMVKAESAARLSPTATDSYIESIRRWEEVKPAGSADKRVQEAYGEEGH